MPNWVDNTLTITGDREDVKAFVERAAQPYTRDYQQYDHDNGEMTWVQETVEPRLSFWNFVKPDDLESYRDNWYSWNVSNWGCKWDTGEVDMDDTSLESGYVAYYFNTPWGHPLEFFQAIVKEYPDLDFNLRYLEEQGWGGELGGSGGQFFVVKEWEIPDTHEDSIEHKGWCNCEEMRDEEVQEWAFKDCPRKKEMSNA